MGWKNCFSADSRRSNQSLSRKSAFRCSRRRNASSIERDSCLSRPPSDSLETEKFIMIIECWEEEHGKYKPLCWTSWNIENEMKIWLITQSKNGFGFGHVFNLNNEWWAGYERLIAWIDFLGINNNFWGVFFTCFVEKTVYFLRVYIQLHKIYFLKTCEELSWKSHLNFRILKKIV